jgi:uncharacterized protein
MLKREIEKSARRAYQKKREISLFLKTLNRKKPKNLLQITKETDKEVWQEIDCQKCAHCCKTMTPTFTKPEVKKIAASINLTYEEYFEKYLMIDADNGDIVNRNTPCQHLRKDNRCGVYEIRPFDCSSFPHTNRKDFLDQSEVFVNNLHRCPATLSMMEKLMKKF